jgi:chorismate dehydratase
MKELACEAVGLLENLKGLKGLSEKAACGRSAGFVILNELGKPTKNVKSLRISVVQYLNTAPLVRGFTHGPLRGKYELSFTVPSQCAEALCAGTVDIAIIPAIEYQRSNELVVLPDLSISSKKTVRSLLLIAKKPLKEVRRVALDRSSRSTQALTRILCAKRWGITPEFFEAEPDLNAMLEKADAALLIGDPALQFSLNRAAFGKLASGTKLGVYDMVEEWRALTSLPAVLAVWAGRPETVTAEVVRDFQASLEYGMQHLDEISEEAAGGMKLPAVQLRRYLVENIDYRLDAENTRGLQQYYKLAAEIGVLREVRDVVMAGATAGAEQQAELSATRPR